MEKGYRVDMELMDAREVEERGWVEVEVERGGYLGKEGDEVVRMVGVVIGACRPDSCDY